MSSLVVQERKSASTDIRTMPQLGGRQSNFSKTHVVNQTNQKD